MGINDFIDAVGEDKLKEAVSSDDPNELKRLAEESGFDLSLEQLDYVAGGVGYYVGEPDSASN